MKRYIIYIWIGLVMSLTACQPEFTTYDGPEYLMFADTLTTLPVMNDTEVFEIAVGATTVSNHDRTLGVEVDYKRSNAVEGKHFDLESHTITIPAGQMSAKVRLRGKASNIGINDSLRVTLRLTNDPNLTSKLYGNETAVMLQRCTPLDINDFKGWALMTSTFLMSYGDNSKKLVYIDVDPDKENSIICRDYFYEGHDCHMTLDASDPLNPKIDVPANQVFASTTQAFGTIYGNGKIMMNNPTGYTSFMSTNERFIYHFMYLTVENVGAVGLFVNLLVMISDEEAEKLKKEGM